jgi:hypothetical protein
MYIKEVYGGGNEADGNAGSVTIGCTGTLVEGENGHAAHPENIGTTLEGIGTVYGGANAADVGSNIELNINSGIVENVFGGNNNSGDIGYGNTIGTITVNIEKTGTCDWYVGNVYGGGNAAKVIGNTYVNIGTEATINFVTKKDGEATPATGVAVQGADIRGNVYGGGNQAEVTGDTHVQIGKKAE